MISKVPVQLTISYLCSPNCHLPPSSTFLHVSNLHHPEWHPLSHLNPAQAHLSPVPSIALLASFHSKHKLRLQVSGHFGQFSVHCTWKLNFIQNSKIIVRTLPPPVRLGPWVWSTHYTGVVQEQKCSLPDSHFSSVFSSQDPAADGTRLLLNCRHFLSQF